MTSLWSLALVASLASSPQALTTSLFEEAAQIKAPPATGALSKADQASNQKAFAKLDTMIDLNAFAASIMQPHAKHFSKKDLKAIKGDFAETVRLIGFPRAGDLRGKATIEITGTRRSKVPRWLRSSPISRLKRLEVELIFHWSNGKSPRVVDLSIDGSSLVTDYRNQFGRIIAKEGAKSLLEKIQKKLATLRQKYGA